MWLVGWFGLVWFGLVWLVCIVKCWNGKHFELHLEFSFYVY
jgi:hypothetical protein